MVPVGSQIICGYNILTFGLAPSLISMSSNRRANSVLASLITFFFPEIMKEPLGKYSPEGGVFEI